MLTIQQIAETAAMYETAMADAMLAACLERAVQTGERLEPVKRRERRREHQDAPESDEIDWEALVRSNREIRALFRANS